MKICPSCGAELGENDARCPICDFALPVAESSENKPEVPEKEVSGLLSDMKARIQRLAGIESEEEPEELESPVSEDEAEVYETPHVDDPIEEEAKADDPQEGSFTITSRPSHGEVHLPGMAAEEKKLPKEPDKIGYKVAAEFSGKKERKRRNLAVTSIIIVLMIILTYLFIIIPSQSSVKPVIDGYFDDWSKVVKYESYTKSDNSEIDFKECAVQMSGDCLYWYFSTNGALFNASSQTSPLISTYSLFIDADGNPGTGFSLIQDFGADDVVVIAGSSGKNSSLTRFYEFYGPDRNNWSSWRTLDSIVVGSMGERVETSFKTPLNFNDTYARYMAFSYDGVSSPSSTLPFSLSPGILLIKQTSLVPASGIINYGINKPVLKVTLTGYGQALPIEVIHPTVSNLLGAYYLAGSVENWSESQMETGLDLTLLVNSTSSDTGQLIKATILANNVISDYGSVVVIGDPAEGYITSLPGVIKIDGIFADWVGLNYDPGDTIAPSNIDIDRIGNSTATAKSCFYIEVIGEMMKGALIPNEKKAPSPSMSSNPWSNERVTGEDIISIYFDLDPIDNKGAPAPFNGSDLRPDLMLQICGRNGLITEATVKSWSNSWNLNSLVNISAAIGDKMIELQVFKTDLTNMDFTNAKYAIVFSDWMGNQDNVTGSL